MNLHIQKVYSLYANVYDIFFGKIFEQGRYAAFEMMNAQPGERILEVGVGTGLSLLLYPKETFVTGIDISKDMLNKAEDKIQQHGLSNVTLYNMDASSMDFNDCTFDKVIASHVITVVPDPLRTLNEIKRVCKKEGEIFLLNYNGCENRFISLIEKYISPLRDRLGLGKHIDLDLLVKDAGLKILTDRRVNFMHTCRLMKCKSVI